MYIIMQSYLLYVDRVPGGEMRFSRGWMFGVAPINRMPHVDNTVHFYSWLFHNGHSKAQYPGVFRFAKNVTFFTVPFFFLYFTPRFFARFSPSNFPLGSQCSNLFQASPVLPFKSDEEKTDEEIRRLESLLAMSKNHKPDMFSISEIMSWLGDAHVEASSSESVKYYILERCDSSEVPRYDAMANSVRQVASQFNSGESPGRYLTHPKEFSFDHTQGPAEQQTSFCAALSRWVYRDQCDSLSPLKLYPEFEQYFDYQFGYLTPRNGFEAQGLAFLKEHVREININVQRVGIDGTRNTAIQVLNASLALGPYDFAREARTKSDNQIIVEMSSVLLTAQYEAVAAVAIQEARKKPYLRIPLCLTLVGAGVFSNDVNAVKNAIGAACDFVEKSGVKNIDVCLSAYQHSEAEIFRTTHFCDAPVLDQEALSALSRLSDYDSTPKSTCVKV